jgi:hypothetical protein
MEDRFIICFPGQAPSDKLNSYFPKNFPLHARKTCFVGVLIKGYIQIIE